MKREKIIHNKYMPIDKKKIREEAKAIRNKILHAYLSSSESLGDEALKHLEYHIEDSFKYKHNLEKQRQYARDNKPKLQIYRQKYFQDNKEEVLSQHKDYYQQNKKKITKKQKKYYQENKKEIQAQHKEYRDRKKLIINKIK